MTGIAARLACVLGLSIAPLFPQETPVFRTDAALVTVPVLVTDARGGAIGDLRQEEFRLYDDGAPRAIDSVWRQPDLPLAMGIVVDTSESQRAFLHEHRTTVDGFLTRMLRTGDRAFVASAADEAVLQAEFIGRAGGVGQVLLPRGGELLGAPCTSAGGRHLCGGTALWNAVYYTAELKLSQFRGGKAMVVLSDGGDTGSTHHFDEAIEAVQRAGVIVYEIRYPGVPSEPELTRLTAETGGVEFAPPRGDYGPVLDRVERDLS